MKVLVAGSTNFTGSDGTKERFRQACRDIGKALALANAEVIVWSDMPDTADRYVVDGILSTPGKHKIHVYRPETGQTPFLKERDAKKGDVEFIYYIMPYERTSERVLLLRAADAVVLIGGGSGTQQLGAVAPVLERPVLAITSFGGGAAAVWPTLEPYYKRLGSLREQMANLQVEWQSANGKLVWDILQELQKRKLFVSERAAPHAIMLSIVLLLLVAWVALFVMPPTIPGVAFFVMLGLSAFLGTALRNSLTLLLDPSLAMSATKIISELSAGLLLAFALTIIYLVGGFTVTGKFAFIKTAPGSDDFQRIALSMTLLGLTGGWLIETVANRIKQWLGGRIKSLQP